MKKVILKKALIGVLVLALAAGYIYGLFMLNRLIFAEDGGSSSSGSTSSCSSHEWVYDSCYVNLTGDPHVHTVYFKCKNCDATTSWTETFSHGDNFISRAL